MNTWDIADDTLAAFLDAWRSVHASEVFVMYLYQNDYSPHPGTVLGDFIVADFPGALPQDVLIGDFESATVTDHIATSQLNHAVTFSAAPLGSFSQTIYGYFVVDPANNYAWSERFEIPRTILAGGEIAVTARLRQGVCPVA
jgi:hypothetical protein